MPRLSPTLRARDGARNTPFFNVTGPSFDIVLSLITLTYISFTNDVCRTHYTAPITAPVSTPNDVPNLERLIDFFSDQDEATALALLDADSPQYRAIAWLEDDAQQNQFTFASSQNRLLQRGALAIFYYSTLGDAQWKTKTNWLDSSTVECTWFGVGCSVDATSIISLVLSENNLGGQVPREVGLLASLEN